MPETIHCPFCGETSELDLDATVSRQQFITDCEFCCRPFEVRVTCEGGEIISVEIAGT